MAHLNVASLKVAFFLGIGVLGTYLGVSKNRGGPPKWMVKIMENPIEMDDLGYPYFWKHPFGLSIL